VSLQAVTEDQSARVSSSIEAVWMAGGLEERSEPGFVVDALDPPANLIGHNT
jgi:hypothetical protein